MKRILVIILSVGLFSCNKSVVTPTPIVVAPIIPVTPTYQTLPTGYYVNKTSYQLKTPFQFVNVDSIRLVLGIRNKGIYNGNNNLGYVYIDINGDGLEDIFYPYEADGNYTLKPDVMINKGNHYELDNSMLPDNFSGTINNRKTLVGDYNNDSLPDLFLINSGLDATPFPGEQCTLLLSDKTTHKYKLGDLSMLPTAFWHGGASGDINGDGNLDIIGVAFSTIKVLYGNGKGEFTAVDWKYKAAGTYFTAEIIDVNKDGQNDIILAGDEMPTWTSNQSPATIFWNNNNDFSKQTIITTPRSDGWGTIVDIAAEDIDGDGINEIFLDRTGDITGAWYGGYKINIYKTNATYNAFSDVTLTYINSSFSIKPQTTGWMYRMLLYKSNNIWMLRGQMSDQTTKTWIQNTTTKIFE